MIALDRKGSLLRAYTTPDGRWRLPVKLEDVDPVYIEILLAFEDRRFWSHSGVDGRAVVRAALQAISSGRVVSGASTLTMQVARLLARRHERTLDGKLTQAIHALQMERKLSKRQILNLYLRMAPFGGNIEGVRAASLAYFGKEPRHLSIAQAALLVALPQSPETRRPDRHRKTARAARDRVLDIAVSQGVVTAAAAKRAKHEPVPRLRKRFPMLAAHLTDSKFQEQPNVAVHRLTIDARLQRDLENLVRAGARRQGQKLSAALIVVDHKTGEVLAHVGSAGYLNASRLGAIDMTKAIRSPGSALKPFIYGQAFDLGIVHPETLIEDRPTRFGVYAPQNFGKDFRGTVSIREALASSLNIPAVKVLEAVGPQRFVAQIQKAGISLRLPGEAKPNLSVALGGLGMSLEDLTMLYVALARGGTPIALSTSLNAATPARAAPTGAVRAILRPESADAITRILRSAPPPPNARGGSIAFKTGTSYGFRDAWAVGYDGRHVIGVWVGRADGTATPDLVGRTAAAPILFDAFWRLSKTRAPFAKPKTRMRMRMVRAPQDLPPPLRRFDRDQLRNPAAAYIEPPLQISFPPDRSEIAVDTGNPLVILKAEGGRLPLTWMADGVPISSPALAREIAFRPRGQGFVKLVVMDAQGRTDRVTVRLSND